MSDTLNDITALHKRLEDLQAKIPKLVSKETAEVVKIYDDICGELLPFILAYGKQQEANPSEIRVISDENTDHATMIWCNSLREDCGLKAATLSELKDDQDWPKYRKRIKDVLSVIVKYLPQDNAYGYASRLFKHLAPQCIPLPDTLGVLTQLDNYITGLREPNREFVAAKVPEEHQRVREMFRAAQAKVKPQVDKEREAEKVGGLGRFHMGDNDIEVQESGE